MDDEKFIILPAFSYPLGHRDFREKYCKRMLRKFLNKFSKKSTNKFINKFFDPSSPKFLVFVPQLASIFFSKTPCTSLEVPMDWYRDTFLTHVEEVIKERKKERIQLFSSGNIDELGITITSRCAAKCTYCYADDEIKKDCMDLSLENFKKSGLNISALKRVTFWGGEPALAIDKIKELINYIEQEKGTPLASNGLITSLLYPDNVFKELKNYIKEYVAQGDRHFFVQISFDPYGTNSVKTNRKYKSLSDEEIHDLVMSRIENLMEELHEEITDNKFMFHIHGVYSNICSAAGFIRWKEELQKLNINENQIEFNTVTNDTSAEFIENIQNELIALINDYTSEVFKKLRKDPAQRLHLMGGPTRVFDYWGPLIGAFSACGVGRSCMMGANGLFTNCTGLTGTHTLSELNNLRQGDVSEIEDCQTCMFNNMCNRICHTFHSPAQCILTQFYFMKHLEFISEFLPKRKLQEYMFMYNGIAAVDLEEFTKDMSGCIDECLDERDSA